PFFAEMTVGIESQVDAASYVAILGNSGELLSKQQRLLTSLQEYPVDGILLCPAKQTPVGVIEHLQRSRVPYVLFTRYLHGTDADYVGADNVSGAALACEHLIAHGHRRIAFVGGPLDSSARGERIQGYSGVLERHGIVLDESLMAITPTTREGGYHAILELLQLPDPPTAAFCYNDVVAFGVMLGLQRNGLIVGTDFAVIGFDDTYEPALMNPGLATIAVKPRQIGEEATKLLFERIADPNRAPRHIVLRARLVSRHSCGCHGKTVTEIRGQ